MQYIFLQYHRSQTTGRVLINGQDRWCKFDHWNGLPTSLNINSTHMRTYGQPSSPILRKKTSWADNDTLPVFYSCFLLPQYPEAFTDKAAVSGVIFFFSLVWTHLYTTVDSLQALFVCFTYSCTIIPFEKLVLVAVLYENSINTFPECSLNNVLQKLHCRSYIWEKPSELDRI